MKTIYKYPFPHGMDTAAIEMHRGAVVRRVAMQGDALCIWAEVDSADLKSVRHFRIVGTGHEIPENGHYLGSCDDDPLVWHVIEIVG